MSSRPVWIKQVYRVFAMMVKSLREKDTAWWSDSAMTHLFGFYF